MLPPTLTILTPAAPGAIAILQLCAPDATTLDALLARASIPVPAPNAFRVGSIAGVDQGVIARWSPAAVHLMSHAGPAVVAEIVRRVRAAGAVLCAPAELDPRTIYPEAADLLDARMLGALAIAASPLAIDLLLDQPRRWREAVGAVPPVAALSDQPTPRDAVLNRLLNPPLVAAFGPPNIGKSTLCNALAGRSVSIVADEPGTTRDHVGVMLELGGLAVRYVDTPGMAGATSDKALGTAGADRRPVGANHGRAVENFGTTPGLQPGPGAARPGAVGAERDAVAITMAMLRSADLILRCGDAGSLPLPLPPGVRPSAGTIDVALRIDLGAAAFPRDLDLAAPTGRGIDALSAAIRERLVPAKLIDDGKPWAFWLSAARPG